MENNNIEIEIQDYIDELAIEVNRMETQLAEMDLAPEVIAELDAIKHQCADTASRLQSILKRKDS